MIVAELQIENYKQFAGAHIFRPDESGVIAVSGDNGAGKTSLFEAIEWCLYNPPRIKRDDIGPHHFPGETRVSITLVDPESGERTVVNRQTKKKQTVVTIFPEDEPERTIVTGSAETARYIRTKLIGLSHKAFEATIFTRQSELGFFADLGATQRRVEVSKLLGLEVIRNAENSLRARANQTRSAANLRMADYESQSAERDFPAELATFDQRLLELRQLAVNAAEELQQRQSTLANLNIELDRLQQQQQEDFRLATDIQRLNGELGKLQIEAEQAGKALQEIHQQQHREASLAALAGNLQTLQAQLTSIEESARLIERRIQLNQILRDATERLTAISAELTDLVTRNENVTVPCWELRTVDISQLPAQARVLHQIATGIDTSAAGTRFEALKSAQRAASGVETATSALSSFSAHLAHLENELRDLQLQGDPTAQLQLAQEQQLRTAQAIATAEQNVNKEIEAVAETNRIMQDLRQEQPSGVCPFCQRPFTDSDRDALLDSMKMRLAHLTNQQTAASMALTAARVEAANAVSESKDAQDRVAALEQLRNRIENGKAKIADQKQLVQQLDTAKIDAFLAAECDTAPTTIELAAAEVTRSAMVQIANSAPALLNIANRLDHELRTAGEAQTAAETVGEPNYDAAQHREVNLFIAAAQRAAGELQELRVRQAEMPRLEGVIAARGSERADLESELTAQLANREALSFKREHLDVALKQVTDLNQSVAAATGAAIGAEAQVGRVEQDRATFLLERDRILSLEHEARQLEQQAELFVELTRAMARFDQFVAQQVTPQLAELTADFLSQVTDGRYSEVQFDDDYGISVMDEQGLFYPLNTFSGGERDVIALCARLALSQLISSQSAAQPRFVVLDEVFGSLDQQRRSNLIDLLTLLIGERGFQQIFLISHVQDIKTASLDQAWLVSRNDNGASQLAELTPGSPPLDF